MPPPEPFLSGASSVPDVIRDPSRLNALHRQSILDTDPEPSFDRITRLAADLLGVDIALINFVGADRQWFKSAVGFDAQEADLETSFCVYPIDEGAPVVVEDAAEDDRFRDNPYVGDEEIRFYAGVPLAVGDAPPIGTICVLGTEPRSLSADEQRQLTDLAGIVERELALHREASKRRRAEQQKELQASFFEAIATGAEPTSILREVCRETEQALSGCRTSILRLEDDRLFCTAAPSLPPDCAAALDGIRATPPGPPFALAFCDGTATISEDLLADERWAGHRDPFRNAGLRSCWAVPIRGDDEAIHGVFVVHGRETGAPSDEARTLMHQMAHVAAVVLESERWEQALRESEEKFRTVVENAQPVVFMLDREGTFQLSEGEGLRVLGLRPGEVVGRSVFELFSDYAAVTRNVRRALDGDTVRREIEIDGLILRCWVSPFYEDGAVAGCIGMAADVTEQRRKEQRLRETEERYRTLVEHFPGAVLLYDEHLRCILAGGERLTEAGVDAGTPEGTTPRERYRAGIAEPLTAHLQAALDGERGTLELEQNGRAYRVATLPVREGEACMAVSLDVTERKEAEQARDRMVEAVGAASDGIAILDAEGTYTYANQAHADIYGYDSPEAFLGNTWRMCYAAPQVERFEETYMPILREEGTWGGEVTGQRKDGTLFSQLVTLTQIKDGGMICVARDITPFKKAARRVRRSEQRFRKVFENAALGIVIGDDEGHILRSNPAFRSMIGGGTQRIAGPSLLRNYPPR